MQLYSKGKKTGVLLDIKLFDKLLEELEDLYDITEAERIIEKKGKRYTLEEVEQSLSAKEQAMIHPSLEGYKLEFSKEALKYLRTLDNRSSQ